MPAVVVVFGLPVADHDLGVEQRVEAVDVQALVAEPALGILAFTSARSPVARPLALAAPPATSSASRGHHGRAPRWATRASRHGLRPYITDGALPRDDPHGRAPSRCLGASGRVRLGGQASSRPAARWTNSMREFSISARVSGSL